MRVVVVGCGSIGQRHARQLIQRSDVALELCDPIEESLTKARASVGDVPIHRSFDAMLGTRPDVLVVATPPSLHADQAIAALRAGIHVLCEKPMSDSLDGARRMRKAAEASDRVLDIGFVMHFHPAMISIKQMIDSGELGKILHIHWHVGTYETLFRSVSRHQANAYGALLLDYAHQPDLLYWWLGAVPLTAYAAGYQAGHLPLSSNPNVLTLTLEYPLPLLATINLNFVQHPGRAYCEVVGEKAWVVFDMASGILQVGQRASENVEAITVPGDADALLKAEQQAFLDAVRGLRQPESCAEKAIHSMLVVDAAIQSLRSKRPEPVATSERRI